MRTVLNNMADKFWERQKMYDRIMGYVLFFVLPIVLGFSFVAGVTAMHNIIQLN